MNGSLDFHPAGGIGFLPFAAGSFATVFFIINLIVWIVLAIAVYRDADSRRRRREWLFLDSPGLWCAVVLLGGGYLIALAYWLIHYSSLRYRREETP